MKIHDGIYLIISREQTKKIQLPDVKMNRFYEEAFYANDTESYEYALNTTAWD